MKITVYLEMDIMQEILIGKTNSFIYMKRNFNLIVSYLLI